MTEESVCKRREDREPTCGIGSLNWTDRSGHTRSFAVTVKNISDGGMQLEMPEEVTVPSMVRLSGQDWECLGWTRYCRKAGSIFLVGIELVRQPFLRDAAEYND